MSEALRRLAESQNGVLTTSQAEGNGVGRRDLSAMVRTGEIVRLGRALYALPDPALDTAEGRHQAVARGGLLLYPDALLSHVTAILAYGLPVFDVELKRVRLLRPRHCEVLTQSFVIRPQRHETCGTTDWGAAVQVAHAIVQFTIEHGVVAGVVAADAALHRQLLSVDDLNAAGDAVEGWPGYGRVRTALSMVDGRSESPGESRLRFDLALFGVAVTPQVVVLDERGVIVARVDLMVDGSFVVIEFDGLVKYREGGAEALIAEKRREDTLRRLGFVVVRVTWAELARPALVRARVRDAVAVAGRRATA